jgi:hypothetical protein
MKINPEILKKINEVHSRATEGIKKIAVENPDIKRNHILAKWTNEIQNGIQATLKLNNNIRRTNHNQGGKITNLKI